MTGKVQPGRIIGGRYRLGQKLGAGGFGQVWSARDEMLAVNVAVKEIRLPPTMSDAERAERMARAEREARNAAQLRGHPNVVAVHDVVMDDAPWIVMQLVAGRSLQQRIEAEGRLSAAEAARIGGGILKALAAAHAAGIVHRDVKPANILLTGEADGTGEVLLGDFGIAVHHADTALTASGAFVGSIEYIAPERARGDDGMAASDLFSLGATLYQAVEGFSPFHRNTPTGSLAAVLFEQPPPPHRAGALEPLLAALLAKDPGARPTAQQALELLGLGGAGTEAPRNLNRNRNPNPNPNPDRNRNRNRNRNRTLAVVGAVVLLAGGGVAWWAAGGGGSSSQKSGAPSSGASSSGASSSGAPTSGAPKSDQLKKVLITDGDLTGYSQNPHALDYSVGMYMYQTQGGCAPMDQLAKALDSGRDDSTPRASASIENARQPTTTSVLVAESVEYYGTAEAQALMKGFHDLSTKCQNGFTPADSGSSADEVIRPITPPDFHDPGVDAVEYDFDSADQQGRDLTVVARVAGTLVTFKVRSDTAQQSDVDPALVTAAVRKAQAAGLPG